MSSIQTDLKRELKEAMKSGDKVRVSVLRDLISALTNAEKESSSELDDTDALKVIKKKAKQRRDSIESFEEGGREDLIKKEEKELEIIEEYLPEQLSDKELENIVDEIIEETGASGMQDMGDVMPAVMGRVGARAEGGRVSEIVKSKLS